MRDEIIRDIKVAIAEMERELLELERLRKRKQADVRQFRHALRLMNAPGDTAPVKATVVPITAIQRRPKASE